MDANILCILLSQRIPPEQFQLWGLEIHWMDESYNTPENRAIVADVINNYEALAAAYLESITPTYADKRRAEYPPSIDLNDALVKQRSSNPAIVAEGQAQEMQYYSDCLAVKARHPKP